MPNRTGKLATDRTGAKVPPRGAVQPVKARDLLPELAPADVPEPAVARMDAGSVDLRALPPEEARPARITVYALNAIVMVFAMPVGAALLALNVFRGEDLRATAHGLALTGAWLGFISTPQGAQFVSGLL